MIQSTRMNVKSDAVAVKGAKQKAKNKDVQDDAEWNPFIYASFTDRE